MPAGTIALTNGSNAVTGSGTSFTNELKQGDFVYVTVGSAPYTLVVSSVTSDTQLTLSIAFDGPTTSGLAWNAVPASIQVAITQKILNDFAQVARGRILDFQNWQKIYSSDQSVTVTRPDKTTFTGPSWGYMATQFAGKANTDDVLTKADNLSSLTDKAISRKNLGFVDGALPIELGGTGAKTKADAWKALATYGTTTGTAAQGDDSRLGTVDGKTAGTITGDTLAVKRTLYANNIYYGGIFRSSVNVNPNLYSWSYFQYPDNGQASHNILVSVSGANTAFAFTNTGNVTAPGQFVSTSDERLKKNITRISDPLIKMKFLKGVTWERLDGIAPGIGFIAQDVMKVFPDNVFNTGERTLTDGTVIKDIQSPDTSGIAAALHHEAILALMEKIETRDAVIAELQNRMKAIDGLDA
ncbi:tail fiber domain-containing protein [Pantoea endophytica]|uniref:tail fiber domain-containing protein n=1 Tax=Pantoea endophytica TaxID=92488 RepID=UPI002413029D|nr:tail fiber domain-containing protein [Pantoea endophytica]